MWKNKTYAEDGAEEVLHMFYRLEVRVHRACSISALEESVDTSVVLLSSLLLLKVVNMEDELLLSSDSSESSLSRGRPFMLSLS